MPYYNVKSFKKSNLKKNWVIGRTWPSLDKFLSFSLSQVKKKKTLKAYIKFGRKLFHLI